MSRSEEGRSLKRKRDRIAQRVSAAGWMRGVPGERRNGRRRLPESRRAKGCAGEHGADETTGRAKVNENHGNVVLGVLALQRLQYGPFCGRYFWLTQYTVQLTLNVLTSF